MDKLYVIEKNNGLSYEDHFPWLDGSSKNYRSASQHLIDQGFSVKNLKERALFVSI